MSKKADDAPRESDVAFGDLTGHEQDALKLALKRGASRREAMQMMVAAGFTATAAGSIVTGATDAMAATPKRGGHIKMAVSVHGPADNLRPPAATGTVDYARQRCHYNSLIRLSDDIVPQPELAEEFSSNSDATEWTFKLRKDVEWHDGSKFDADDVLYSMSAHYGDDSVSVVKSLVANVTEWKKTDQYTVKAILDTPNADLAAILGEKQFKIFKNGTTDFINPVGTGPYKLKDFQPGVRSFHVRNENYWADGPNLDSVEILGITDPIARVNALLSSDIDMMSDLNPKAIKQVEETSGTEVFTVPSGAFMGMCMLKTKHPGNNDDFVRGMKLLHRREKLVKSLLKGHGTVGNDHPINIAYGVDFCDDLPITPYDPDQAKFYLNKSGVTGAEIVVGEVTPGVTDACLLWQRECQKIGFDLMVKKVTTDGYWGAVWQQEPMNVTTWSMRPTATVMLDIAFAPDAPWSDSFWKDERMGKLLTMAKKETNPAKRHEIQCDMQKLVKENAGVIIPAHVNIVDAHASNIKGIPRLALGNLGACEWPEFIWKE